MAELSPGERQRIYEEEKVRKEAQDTLKQGEDKLKKEQQKKILSTEVRILDGPNKGKSGLVPAEWVKR